MEAQKMRLALLLVAVAAMGVVVGGRTQCWELHSCQELNSESSVMECIQFCESTLNKMPILPSGSHHPPSPSSEPLSLLSIPSPQTKRSYSMEHFRWGKPIGRKRRPVKIYTSNSVEELEESADLFPKEMRRRELPRESNGLQNKEKSSKEELEKFDSHEDDDSMYKMKHFRWGAPPASKRYGGFMRSWDEHSQRPLITLLKTVINKEGEEQ
ncbi:Pro-opiomelanocortin [Oryzias melastigma]|uniref:Pro-opiomelanocortin n=1 Tax=Oryzias melastigma TaxID=30732 RepID=A0A834KZ83_ORYME|nr:Pro-opiomelanocortin [Oryzias melastigma]